MYSGFLRGLSALSKCGLDDTPWKMERSVGFNHRSGWTQLDVSCCLHFFYSETHENWTWFMIHLRRAIGNLPLLAVSTDAYDGLENAVKDVFPHAEQRECFCNTPGVTVAVTVYLQ
jgi:hypothetical protein